jgi:D-amino-acid dehydrogenase
MHIAVIGNGIVGTCCAAWLQRDGHRVTFVDPLGPAEATSFGNAGSLSPSACLPVGMPGMWKKVPRWLLDPLGPLAVRWWYAPVAAPWIARFLRASDRTEVVRIATALRGCWRRSSTATSRCCSARAAWGCCAGPAASTSIPARMPRGNGPGG